MDPDRPAGRTRYVWRSGVLGWGLPVGVFYAVTMAYFFRDRFGYGKELLFQLCFLPLWALAGYVYGRIMWRRANRPR